MVLRTFCLRLFLLLLAASPPAARAQFATGAVEQTLRGLLPDRELAAEPRLKLWTEREQPRVYQHSFMRAPGLYFHLARYNTSMGHDDGSEPFGNANREFPWDVPAGTHRCPNTSSFKFLLLPVDGSGRQKPIVWFTAPKMHSLELGYRQPGYDWVYPLGTIVGEVLTMKSPAATDVTFELRTRLRTRDGWEPGIRRPFPTALHLAAALRRLHPDWESRPDVAANVRHCETDIPLKRLTIRDAHPDRRAFEATVAIDTLPSLNPATVDRLLSEFAFDDATGQTWRGEDCFAPTTEADWHIVPPRYDGSIAGNDTRSCARCHDTVGRHVDEFDFPRDWYGHVRGGDRIFSLTPIDQRCVSDDGSNRPVRMLQIAGLFERFDPARHARDDYREIKQ